MFFVVFLLVIVATGYINDLIAAAGLKVALAVAIGMVLSIGSSWFLTRVFIRRPIRDLVSGMSALAERDLEYRMEEDGSYEFDSIATSFNEMASMLSSSMHELKRNQDYLHSILESSADIIITVNPSGNIQTINTGAENTLGYSRMEVIGKPMDEFFADPTERQVAIDRLAHTDNVVNYETRFVTKDGQIRDVLLTLSRLRNSMDDVIGTIGISKDVTEEKRLQAKLIQSQRLAAIGEVFTGIQHSMKNMLNACKGGAYMVRTGLKKDNRTMLVDGWDMVQEGINRMSDMATDMLKYVKEWVPHSERVDLTKSLNEISHIVKQSASDKGITFTFNSKDQLPLVMCDAIMIHSAVMDVVSNAIDACYCKDYTEGETPSVAMKAFPSQDGQNLIIEIIDNGCGMTEEVKANIFTPFFSTKSKAGTGLGLSLTSRAVTVHGGTIKVESEPDKGSIFRFVLPVNVTAKHKVDNNGEESSCG